jgi:hypothetical protein
MFLQIMGQALFKGEINTKNAKRGGRFKNQFLGNHWTRKAEIYMKAF